MRSLVRLLSLSVVRALALPLRRVAVVVVVVVVRVRREYSNKHFNSFRFQARNATQHTLQTNGRRGALASKLVKQLFETCEVCAV